MILVAGIGNIFLGDDAFGVEVAQRLAKSTLPQNVHVKDFGIRGFDLAYALMDETYDTAILVDAMPRGGEPGSVYAIEPDLTHLQSMNEVQMETHGMNPMKVFELVRAMGGNFNRIFIVGCEPESFGGEEGRMGLSEPVRLAVPKGMELVRSLIDSILQGTVTDSQGPAN